MLVFVKWSEIMELLKNMISEKGKVINEDILKVDSFLNHQVDYNLMKEIGTYFYNYFKDKNITKIFTIESSGIAPAIMTASEFKVPMVFLKKQKPNTLNSNVYQTEVKSFTKGTTYNLTLSKDFILENDNILIIDDFLANGEAAKGAIKLIKEAGAKVAGIGIVIEKSFQPGRKYLETQGYDVYSLARIKSLKENKIEFVD